jgi:hypothetical protein
MKTCWQRCSSILLQMVYGFVQPGNCTLWQVLRTLIFTSRDDNHSPAFPTAKRYLT